MAIHSQSSLESGFFILRCDFVGWLKVELTYTNLKVKEDGSIKSITFMLLFPAIWYSTQICKFCIYKLTWWWFSWWKIIFIKFVYFRQYKSLKRGSFSLRKPKKFLIFRGMVNVRKSRSVDNASSSPQHIVLDCTPVTSAYHSRFQPFTVMWSITIHRTKAIVFLQLTLNNLLLCKIIILKLNMCLIIWLCILYILYTSYILECVFCRKIYKKIHFITFS